MKEIAYPARLMVSVGPADGQKLDELARASRRSRPQVILMAIEDVYERHCVYAHKQCQRQVKESA